MSPVDSPSSPPPPVPAPIVSTNPKVAAQQAAAADAKNIVRRKLTGYVGFANLPNQWHRKSVRKGFNFNVMVVGTLVRSGDFRVSGDACMMLTVM
jgi:septin 7